MFQLMRNVHLILGLVFFLFAMIFAVSSLVIIYRPWLPQSRHDEERTIKLASGSTVTPRELALDLMRDHGLKGELRDIEQDEQEIHFAVVRPGSNADVEYVRSTGEAKVHIRTQGLLETTVQLHTNHGFWHDFLPSNVWSMLSLLGSVALFFLGATGIYLWFCHHEERIIGGVLLVVGLAYGLTTLVLSRTAG
jgi:hypothetical protein